MMLSAPIPATKRAIAKTGLKWDDLDVVECNEAFAPVPMALLAETPIPHAKLNPNGGGISLGHPIGATGARIMTTMLHELERTGGRYGLQTMCEGGGVANVTWIGDGGDLLAFDTGPGNGPIDDWCSKRAGLRFDKDGALAASGKVNRGRLERFSEHRYFARTPPKSLDRGDFNDSWVEGLSAADGAATLTRGTARAIALGALTAQAQTFRWAAQNDVLTLDPHSQNHATTNNIMSHVYETLVRYDQNNRIEPSLATSRFECMPAGKSRVTARSPSGSTRNSPGGLATSRSPYCIHDGRSGRRCSISGGGVQSGHSFFAVMFLTPAQVKPGLPTPMP